MCGNKHFENLFGKILFLTLLLFLIIFKVGDPAQLPATVISDVAKNHG